ncbi:MAG: WHG domain-containing protein [Actinotalea sp.]|nr:WHG domain-containing protein [Actinotalea sp.]
MPRAGLNRDAVVALGVACVEDGGVTAFTDLTLAAVAARAGVAVPSLYKHVGGLPDLRQGVALVAVRRLAAVLEAALADPAADGAQEGSAQADGGPSPLARVAHAVRDHARARPGLYAATQAPALLAGDGPDTAALAAESRHVVDLVGRAVPRTTDDDAARVHAVRAVRAALHGFLVLEMTGGFGLPEDVDASFAHLVRVLERGTG